ncbi:peptidoglycan/xylan/chitin deacetylase (PgdA/CDA1 family) [Lachnotalea glycerini]|uniref:Peptidoglycan/xylan/chitin deacetylase (PgdA/CDA1 family) n=2 Tax=Lachnotalea glycerini TaxID=1763509 RepID=A0A318EVH8_9FIRM|nr:polysaccharide deacetylase family protein [Lachnotalea glycerini]PXV93540.1 peptidoglycan/xylan/chitin deacetylase (PgdA/CDA1 family) [Lachnotalea glycerini]
MNDAIMSIEEKNRQRKARIGKIKKLIVGSVIVSILFPTILSLCLMLKVFSLQEQVNELTKMIENKKESSEVDKTVDLADGVYATELPENMQVQPMANVESTTEANSNEIEETIVYLTFDDGPSENTSSILDILKEHNVKATFFVTGKETDEAKALYKRIVDEGHTLGMHSYSHQYSEIYNSVESFANDERKLRDLLYEVTGVIPTLYRFPGGSSNLVSNIDMTEFIKYLKSEGITYFDWNVASGDAASQNVDVDTLVNNVLNDVGLYHTSVVLMHDTTEKTTSVEALGKIIESIQALGIEMRPLDENVPPVQHIKAESVNN